MVNVSEIASQQIVDSNDGVSKIEQRFREVRADEAGSAGYDDAFHETAGSINRRAYGRSCGRG